MLSAVLESIRLAVGLCFFVAAWTKARDIAGFRRGIETFRVTPASWSGFIALTVILAEATMALSFLGGFYLKIAGWMGLALMAGFGVATASAAVRGVVVSCNCFGASGAEATSMQGWLRWTFLTVGVGLVCIWTTTPMWPSAARVVQLDVWIAGACMAVACASVTRLFDPMVWHWKTGHAASDGDGWA